MRLIINADDFGLSKSISDGIIEGIKGGYITSTSVMANMEYAEYAVKEAVKNNISCVGLHINLTAGKPIINNQKLTDDKGVFLYNRKQIDNPELTCKDAYNEIKAQIEMVDKYSDGLLKIDHLDMHHQLCENENAVKALERVAKEYNIPARNEYDCDVVKPDILDRAFTINNITVDYLRGVVSKYQDKDITVELMTHPGHVDEYTKSITSYVDREKELQTLKATKEEGIFDKIELISFGQL